MSDIETHEHIGSCVGYALLTSHGKATKPRKDEFRKRVGTIIERTLTGEARMDTYKDKIAETERVTERIRARVERGAGDVPEEPGNRDDEQVAVRHADASGGYIIENQHEEDRMRAIQVSTRGSEATSEEQSTTNKFLRWMHSTRWMDERVVTSEKCWSGIEEKIREISREVNYELVETWTCLNALERKIWKINPKILMDEKSWKAWIITRRS